MAAVSNNFTWKAGLQPFFFFKPVERRRPSGRMHELGLRSPQVIAPTPSREHLPGFSQVMVLSIVFSFEGISYLTTLILIMLFP
jgi:hypothetical protein